MAARVAPEDHEQLHHFIATSAWDPARRLVRQARMVLRSSLNRSAAGVRPCRSANSRTARRGFTFHRYWFVADAQGTGPIAA